MKTAEMMGTAADLLRQRSRDTNARNVTAKLRPKITTCGGT